MALYYRDVRKEDVIASIRLACAYLKKLNLGPETERKLNELAGPDGIRKLELARNDPALYLAIHDTDIRSALTRFSKIIRFHALEDQAAGKQASEALSVYRKLMAWSAFFPGQDNQPAAPIDGEINAHLLSAMARSVAPDDEEPESAAQKRLTAFLKGVSEEEILQKQRDRRKAAEEGKPQDADDGPADETARWLAEMIPLVTSLGRLGDCETEIRTVLSTNARGAEIMPRAFETMLNVDQRERALNVDTPIRPYKVVFALPKGNGDEIKKALLDVVDMVIDTLSPYFYGDELEGKIDMALEDNGEEVAVEIYTTREAAQLLANSLPSNLRVVDSNGQRVARRSPPSSSPPAPNPW